MSSDTGLCQGCRATCRAWRPGIRGWCLLVLLVCPFLTVVSVAQEVLRGVDYGPYREGQSPVTGGDHPTPAQLQEDMALLQKQACVLRTYSVLNGFDVIPPYARQQGLRVVPGAWIGSSAAANDAESAKLIEVANANSDIPFVSVGSEALLRFENGWPDGLAKAQLLALIDRVKQQVSVPVTTAEPWHIWRDHNDLAAAVDLLFVNVHPYWEGQSIDTAVSFVGQRYAELKQRYPAKRIVVSETGWPTCGSAQGAAVPSIANQERFLTELLAWAERERVELFYFEAFDEPWKTMEPNGVGPCWGLYTRERSAKHAVISTRQAATGLAYYTVDPCRAVDTRNPTGPVGGPALAAGADRTFTIAQTCNVPASAKAVTVNVTVTAASDPGDLRLFPAGGCTFGSSLNYAAGQTRANNATTGLDADGRLTVRSAQAAGTVHFVLDVTGYMQ